LRPAGAWYSGRDYRIESGKALSFDFFDRNDAAAPIGRWRATFWRRSRA